MPKSPYPRVLRLNVGVLGLFVMTACAGGPTPAPAPTIPPLPHVQADVDFMQGMIPHHAQAVLFSRWAESHGAARDVLVLAQRIVVAQQDEIRLMQTWLRARDEDVPAADATHHTMVMDGVEHKMLMPGMLTDEELAEMEAARGPEFDRLFLTYMIKHHGGALTMVDELFESYGAAQDETVFRFASDVHADQSTEINRMYEMLDARNR